MNWPVVVPSTLAGLSFVVTIVVALLNRKKIKAEADKTGADAVAVLTASAVQLLIPIKEELQRANEKIEAMGHQLDIVEGLLRENGLPVPPRYFHKPLKAVNPGGK
jgi:hypothetical protein